jgi:hypothetical protein
VGTRVSPRTSWSASTMTAWIFVPPRSMPPRMARAYPHRAGQIHDAASAVEVGSTMGA